MCCSHSHLLSVAFSSTKKTAPSVHAIYIIKGMNQNSLFKGQFLPSRKQEYWTVADWHFLYYSLHKFLPIIKFPKVSDASSSTWALEPTSASFPSLFWVVSLFLFTVKREVKSLSHVRLLATPWAPVSMGFSRQEYWSGLPFPSPGGLPDSGIEPGSPALQADALPSKPPGKPFSLRYPLR